MGCGSRVYYLDDNDAVHKFSASRLNRLLDGREPLGLPEFAGKRIRFATINLETENRRPQRILSVDFLIYEFDVAGQIDKKAWEELMRDSAELYGTFLDEKGFTFSNKQLKPSNVIQAGHYFKRKQYDRKYRWSPSDEILAQIQDDIFRGE